MITTVLAFLFTLGVLVVIHEYGHYRVAVACGVKVLRFSVGFGKVLWRRQSSPDATEFVLCALPLGGYVRMLDEREAPVPPSQQHMAFNRKTLWQRAAIVSAGPAANLLLAVLLYAAAHWIGIEEPKAVMGTPVAGSVAERAGLRAGDWAQAVSADGEDWQPVRSLTDLRWQVTQAALQHERLQLQVSDAQGRGTRNVVLDLSALDAQEVDAALARKIGLGNGFSEPVLGEVKPGGPAAKAGLRSGDRVISIDGTPIIDAQNIVDKVLASVPSGVKDGVRDGVTSGVQDGEPLAQQWLVQRAGQSMTLAVLPRLVTEGGKSFGRIDAAPGQPAARVTVRHGFFEGLQQGAARTWEMSSLTVRMLGRMLIGEASIKNLSGPLTIADYAGQSVNLGLAYYLGFLALVSVSLGVLNLLPLPMLDGGHLMYYIFEGVTGRPVSELWLARLQRGGVVLLLMMMSVALFNDVARLLG